MYNQFNKVVDLTVNQWVNGQEQRTVKFQTTVKERLQFRLNRGWSRTPQNVSNVHEFEKSSIKLSYFKEEVTELKINKLKALNGPVAIVKACHSNGSHNLQMMLEDLSLYFTLQEEPD